MSEAATGLHPEASATGSRPKMDARPHVGGAVMFLLVLLAGVGLVGYSVIRDTAAVGEPLAMGAFGQALFGHIDLQVAGSLVIGSVPGTFIGAMVSSRAPDAIVRPVLVALLVSSGLALLITSYTGLAWALGIVALVGLALWGAVDATLHPSDDWLTAGHDRTKWVALMGIGAPLGIGVVAGVILLAGATWFRRWRDDS